MLNSYLKKSSRIIPETTAARRKKPMILYAVTRWERFFTVSYFVTFTIGNRKKKREKVYTAPKTSIHKSVLELETTGNIIYSSSKFCSGFQTVCRR
jgi:hypothetical protein